jgi:outer membrane protein OmpU
MVTKYVHKLCIILGAKLTDQHEHPTIPRSNFLLKDFINMKKLIVGATLALFSVSPAVAADQGGLDLGVHGYFKAYTAWADQGGTGGDTLRNVDMVRDTELHITGETTLDNGLTVGADVGVDGDQGGGFDVADSFVYFAGNFGKLNVGSTDGAAYLLQVQAPAVDANYDGMDQYFTPFNYSVTSVTGLSDIEFDYDQDVTTGGDKLTYISPMYDGFQFGVSWTPEVRTASRGTNGVDTATGLADVVDVAARFGNETSWGDYSVGAGYTTAEDRSVWNAGVDANMGAFGVGVVYTHDDEDEGASGTASGQTQWIAGVDYTSGAMTYAASYLNQNNEFGSNDIDTDRYTVGAVYSVGSGVDFRGAVTWIDHQVDAGLGSDIDGTAVMLGTSITF